jgi:hypothetical protein
MENVAEIVALLRMQGPIGISNTEWQRHRHCVRTGTGSSSAPARRSPPSTECLVAVCACARSNDRCSLRRGSHEIRVGELMNRKQNPLSSIDNHSNGERAVAVTYRFLALEPAVAPDASGPSLPPIQPSFSIAPAYRFPVAAAASAVDAAVPFPDPARPSALGHPPMVNPILSDPRSGVGGAVMINKMSLAFQTVLGSSNRN